VVARPQLLLREHERAWRDERTRAHKDKERGRRYDHAEEHVDALPEPQVSSTMTPAPAPQVGSSQLTRASLRLGAIVPLVSERARAAGEREQSERDIVGRVQVSQPCAQNRQ
jgi:hypothetical protein